MRKAQIFKTIFIAIFFLNCSMASIYAFTLKVTAPSSTGICYASGDFNGWNFYQMTLISSGSTKVFTLDVGTSFTGLFKILSGPDWQYQQTDPQFSAGSVIESVGVTVNSFLAIYNPISRVIKIPTKNYIEYKGEPYLQYGIQSRIDDYLGTYPYTDVPKLNTAYQYFEKTASCNFKDILVPLPWNWFETSDNVFNNTMLDLYIGNANYYNLRIQLLWYGSNACGWSSNVPDYINNDKITYPRISTNANAPLVLNNANLLSKETRAMTKLMNYLATNDPNKRVMMIQVENEPDHMGPTTQLWAGNQKAAALQSINALGQIIHASASGMATRVNLTGWATADDVNDFRNISGIDIFGRDSYQYTLSDFLSGSKLLECNWNSNHTPENGAQYKNSINLASAGFDKGDGYYMYELRTTAWRTSNYDLGLYRNTINNDWIERDGTLNVNYTLDNKAPNFQTEVKGSEVDAFNEMIYKADKKIANRPDNNIVAFNTANGLGQVWETESLPPYSIDYYSPTGGEALALLDDNGEIVLFSLNASTWFKITTVPSNFHYSIGYFDDTNNWHQTSSGSIVNNQLTLNAKDVALLTNRTFINESIPAKIANVETLAPGTVDKTFCIYEKSKKIFIQTPNMSGDVKLYDLRGIKILQKKVTGELTDLDSSHLSAGIYIIEYEDNIRYKPQKIYIN